MVRYFSWLLIALPVYAHDGGSVGKAVIHCDAVVAAEVFDGERDNKTVLTVTVYEQDGKYSAKAFNPEQPVDVFKTDNVDVEVFSGEAIAGDEDLEILAKIAGVDASKVEKVIAYGLDKKRDLYIVSLVKFVGKNGKTLGQAGVAAIVPVACKPPFINEPQGRSGS